MVFSLIILGSNKNNQPLHINIKNFKKKHHPTSTVKLKLVTTTTTSGSRYSEFGSSADSPPPFVPALMKVIQYGQKCEPTIKSVNKNDVKII